MSSPASSDEENHLPSGETPPNLSPFGSPESVKLFKTETSQPVVEYALTWDVDSIGLKQAEHVRNIIREGIEEAIPGLTVVCPDTLIVDGDKVAIVKDFTLENYWVLLENAHSDWPRLELRDGVLTALPKLGRLHQAVTTAVSDYMYHIALKEDSGEDITSDKVETLMFDEARDKAIKERRPRNFVQLYGASVVIGPTKTKLPDGSIAPLGSSGIGSASEPTFCIETACSQSVEDLKKDLVTWFDPASPVCVFVGVSVPHDRKRDVFTLIFAERARGTHQERSFVREFDWTLASIRKLKRPPAEIFPNWPVVRFSRKHLFYGAPSQNRPKKERDGGPCFEFDVLVLARLVVETCVRDKAESASRVKRKKPSFGANDSSDSSEDEREVYKKQKKQ